MKLLFDVTAAEYQIVRDVLATHLGDECHVWVFGSRAKNTARFNSDLDLAIECTHPLSKQALIALNEAFDEAKLAFSVDVVDLQSVEPFFKSIIDSQKVVFPLSHRVPQLRFPEFSGEWDYGNMQNLINSLDAGVSVNSVDEPAQLEELAILKTSCVTNGFFNIAENKKVIEQSEMDRLKEPVCAGTIIISRMNTPNLVGANAYVASDFKNVFLPDRLWAAKVSIKASSRWVSFLTGSPKIRALISARATGTSDSMKNITKTDVMGLPVFYPSLPEQTKIAAFLSAVDTKIDQLTQKKALLDTYKKGAMQQIFSQQIRFTPDEGGEYPEWEERKLGEVATFFSGGTPTSTKKEYYSGSIPFIGSGKIGSTEVEQFITEEALTNSSAKMVRKGDLLYALYGATSGEVAISKIDGAINQAVLCIRSKENIIFIFYWLFFEKENILSTYLQGGQGNLSAQIIKSFVLSLPSYEEQTKIANFLSAIDRKIDLVSQQLEQAKAFKKGLLQQMFV